MTDEPSRVAWVFPGQGSQHEGMASAWLPAARETYEELAGPIGMDLPDGADADDLGTSTRRQQRAILAVELAVLEQLRAAGLEPAVVAGHSLGELGAAVAAGVLSSTDAARLVAERADAMADACAASPGGLVALVGVTDGGVEHVLDGTGAAVANDNLADTSGRDGHRGRGQAVVGGPTESLEAVLSRAEDAGVRAVELDVEGAFHTEAMRPARERVADAVAGLEPDEPVVGLVSGVDGVLRTDGRAVLDGIVEGVVNPVRWSAVMATLRGMDLDLVVEVGPGDVLAGLAKRGLPDLEVVGLTGPEDVAALAERLGVATASSSSAAAPAVPEGAGA